MIRRCHRRSNRRPGLTLVELLIVLTILAVLTLAAVASVDPVIQQARFDRTQQSLQSIRTALVSSATRGPDGTMLLSGYVLQMGSLPTSIVDLLVSPTGVESTVQAIDTDFDGVADSSLPGGWAGPYVEIPVAATAYTDGWGNALTFSASGTPPTLTVTSLGADGAAGAAAGGAYDADLTTVLQPTEYRGLLSFRVYQLDSTGTRLDPTLTGTQRLGIVIAGVNADPNLDQPGLVQRWPQAIPVAAVPAFELSNVQMTAGQIACRALLWDDTSADGIVDAGETVLSRSVVQYLTLAPGHTRKVLLDLAPLP